MEENINFNVETTEKEEETQNTRTLPESLRLSQYALENLDEIRKWTKFFAIMGFIGSGLMVLGGIGFSTIGSFSGLGFPGFFGLIYIAFAVLCFFPSFYLLNFSNRAKNALEESDEVLLEESMVELRKSFRFIGIMAIAILALYIVLILISLLGVFASL